MRGTALVSSIKSRGRGYSQRRVSSTIKNVREQEHELFLLLQVLAVNIEGFKPFPAHALKLQASKAKAGMRTNTIVKCCQCWI
jgi:hypothetical protein